MRVALTIRQTIASRASRIATASVLAGAAICVTLPATSASAAGICITAVVLPTAQYGSTYAADITTSYIGSGRISMTAAGLPPGLTMSPAGFVSGVPTQPGTYTPTFSLTAAVGCGSKALKLTVSLDKGAQVSYWQMVRVNGSDFVPDVPHPAPGLFDITEVASDTWGGTFLRGNGTVWEQSYPDTGPTAATQVPGLSGITHVTGNGNLWPGEQSAEGTGYALGYDGTVWAWGDNRDGNLGVGTVGGLNLVPTRVPGLTNVVAISASQYNEFVYALTGDGQVWGWGANYEGALAGAAYHQPTPFRIAGMTNVVAITTGFKDGYGLRADGTVLAIGDDSLDQLGTWGLPSSLVQVAGLSGVTAIASAGDAAYALIGGQDWSWGDNGTGEDGHGNSTSWPYSPEPVANLTGVTGIGANQNAGYAIVGGRLWGWGQMDANGDYDSGLPEISTLTGVLQVSGNVALHLVTLAPSR
jgi:Regulator of chromosome condensation (RCC1) repeat